ncbi:4-phosphoerythronate dehydrogenase [Legionella dresdenensis]|uniref:4-phosphoerythronate dehydrogenase n=1 Tax=Legionella dresdenensis TaxID=450200 RepID=A0ABV8CD30_9GAMM
MKIIADATLPGLAEAFPHPFELSLFEQASDLHKHLHGQDILLCRSTLHVDEALLDGHHLRYVATASSGTDHIDKHYLDRRDIQLIDAKGSNAIAVADYVLSCLAYLQTYTDFKPPLPYRERAGERETRKAAVIGMGAVGSIVAQRLQALGYPILSFDPPRAERDPAYKSAHIHELAECNLICIHASLHDNEPYPSRNLLDKQFLQQLKPNTAIINASRGEIVSEDALLKLSTPLYYCTDVYADEPDIDAKLVDYATLCTPHIAGHSIEAKLGAVRMVSEKLHHACKLALPTFTPALVEEPRIIQPGQSWQNYILSLFNPVDDTVGLKLASDKTEAFLKLRKAHSSRHDFRAYAPEADHIWNTV